MRSAHIVIQYNPRTEVARVIQVFSSQDKAEDFVLKERNKYQGTNLPHFFIESWLVNGRRTRILGYTL